MLSYSSTIQTDLKVYNSVFITDHPLYASTITLGNANVIPVAYPDAYNVDQNGMLTITVENGVLSNDVDTDNLLTAELVSDVSNGTLILNANGSFTYNPNDLYYGQDSFTYRVFDRKAYSNIETVIITVNQVITWNELIANIHEDRVIADGGLVLDKPKLIADLDTIGEANYNNLTFLMNPNGGSKSGKIHAIKPEDGTADLTVDRNSEAYFQDEGEWKKALINEPRITSQGELIVEPQSTNLFKHSNNFLNSIWIKNNVTVIPGYEDINGENNAYKLTSDIADGTHSLDQPITTSSGKLIVSYLCKSAEISQCLIRESIKTGKTRVFDLENGVSSGDLTGGMFFYGNGWYRIWAEYTYISDINRQALSLIPNTTFVYQGDGISGIIIMHPQMEKDNLTTYIPTDEATSTRLSDNISVTPPTGTTQIIETIDGIEQTPITTIPATYQIPEGNINQIKML